MQASQRNDPNLKNSQAITRFLPLMIGYFALSVPSGLSLYWFTNNMLSAAQQVWLQKLGGATTPSRDFSDIISRDDQSQFQKSVPGTNSSSTGASQGKKLTPKGLRPGERFNRIKEQEARRRLQREEEKKRALEAADNLTQTSERHRRDSEFVEVQNGGEADLVDVKNERLESMAKIPEPSNGVVNEGVAKQDWEEDRERTAILMIKNGGIPVSTEVGQSNRQHLNESFEQDDDVVEMCTTATAGDRKLSSGEHVPQAMPETHARRED